jgi:hypothetical protein
MAVLKNKMGGGAVAEAPTSFNLSASFPLIITQLEAGVNDKSTAFLDKLIGMAEPQTAAALAEMAALIGFSDYNPDTHSTFFVSVDEKTGSKNTYGPKLVAFQTGLAIVWSKVIIPIAADTSIDSKDLFLFEAGEKSASFTVNTRGACMPISVMLADRKGYENQAQEMKRTIATAGDLMPYLQRGEEIVKWEDVAEGSYMELYKTTAVYDNAEPPALRYCIGLVELNGEIVRVYCPGEASDWVNFVPSDAGFQLTKTGPKLIQDSTGREHVLKAGGSWVKFAKLQVGITYKCIEFGMGEGNKDYPAKPYVKLEAPDGTVVSCNANSYISKRWNQGTPEMRESITAANPGTLTIVSMMGTGKFDKNGDEIKNVEMSLQWPQGKESMLERLARESAEAQIAALKDSADATPELPFKF